MRRPWWPAQGHCALPSAGRPLLSWGLQFSLSRCSVRRCRFIIFPAGLGVLCWNICNIYKKGKAGVRFLRAEGTLRGWIVASPQTYLASDWLLGHIELSPHLPRPSRPPLGGGSAFQKNHFIFVLTDFNAELEKLIISFKFGRKLW